MRILQILHDRERGGILTLATMIEDGLRAHGAVIDTDYLFPRPGLDTLSKLRCAAAMARRIARGGFDALLAYQATASILVGVVGRLQGCRIRLVHQTCTPGETALPVRLADRLAGTLGFYTANIANCGATRDEFTTYPKRYRGAMTLIEHGLDSPVATASRAETRARFALPQRAPLLLNVGRLVPQKNQHVLIRALAHLPDCHLAVAGDGGDGAALTALAAELGVTSRVHLLGALSSADVANLYAAADLFVFPSTWETFGLAAAEAAMAGVPMVVADLAVLREVLSTTVPAPVRFASPHDPEAWTASIRAALAAPPAAAQRQAFAREMAGKYSRQRMIESYLRLLDDVAQAPPPSGVTVGQLSR